MCPGLAATLLHVAGHAIDVCLQVTIIIRRKVQRGMEAQFEAVLTRMYEVCAAEVKGSAGASFVRPAPGSKSNEYLVRCPRVFTCYRCITTDSTSSSSGVVPLITGMCMRCYE